jgi:hypothetical protein
MKENGRLGLGYKYKQKIKGSDAKQVQSNRERERSKLKPIKSLPCYIKKKMLCKANGHCTCTMKTKVERFYAYSGIFFWQIEFL